MHAVHTKTSSKNFKELAFFKVSGSRHRQPEITSHATAIPPMKKCSTGLIHHGGICDAANHTLSSADTKIALKISTVFFTVTPLECSAYYFKTIVKKSEMQ